MKIYLFDKNENDFLNALHDEKIILDRATPFLVNDCLLFVQENNIMGLSKIQAIQYIDNTVHLTLTFDFAFKKENRVSFNEQRLHNVFSTLTTTDSSFLSISDNDLFLKNLSEFENDLGFFLVNLEYLMEESAEVTAIQEKRVKRMENQISFSQLTHSFSNEHQKSQYLINEIGNICEVQTWTASNDKNRSFYQRKLGDMDIESFPILDIPKTSQERIELIDNIWIKGSHPICAFETEITSTIYSGLLRLADLATVLSTSNLQLYIVAPKAREKKFLTEIKRPTFQRLQMEQYCHFISIESLEILYQKIKGLDGYIDYNIVNVIAQSAKQLEKIHYRGANHESTTI